MRLGKAARRAQTLGRKLWLESVDSTKTVTSQLAQRDEDLRREAAQSNQIVASLLEVAKESEQSCDELKALVFYSSPPCHEADRCARPSASVAVLYKAGGGSV